MRKIAAIVVHCTDSPDDLDVGAAEIDEWHREKGWNGIGYHYVVRRDGTIEVGRFESAVGAHVRGMNSTSIGVVWVGRGQPSTVQRSRLVALVRELADRYQPARILGHHEADPNSGKTCPNLSMDLLRAEVEQ